MPLIPINEKHKLQIIAGSLGRIRGHDFEKLLTEEINAKNWKGFKPLATSGHLYTGDPVPRLLSYIVNTLSIEDGAIESIQSWWLGGLATLREGDVIDEDGIVVAKSKSDVLIKIVTKKSTLTIGVSVKTCNKRSPTNDQLYFTTATGFSNLLKGNHIVVSDSFEDGLKMFCGDTGFRPLDLLSDKSLKSRVSDPSRFFFEELPDVNKTAIIKTFTKHQEQITRILLQKAYPNDPYEPLYLIHQTHSHNTNDDLESAIFRMDEIIEYSQRYASFILKPYVIRKGSFKHDDSEHFAPRFGFIQFQRGGQKQHPTQLQFNLKAGYFYNLPA